MVTFPRVPYCLVHITYKSVAQLNKSICRIAHYVDFTHLIMPRWAEPARGIR